jgi:hypothetical protein
MAKKYPDYDVLREQYEAGNISAVDFVLQQSEEEQKTTSDSARMKTSITTVSQQRWLSWTSVKSSLRKHRN